jgi:ABC-type nitrate/sulfonate/bicarbonate transport system substrate-binding protein
LNSFHSRRAGGLALVLLTLVVFGAGCAPSPPAPSAPATAPAAAAATPQQGAAAAPAAATDGKLIPLTVGLGGAGTPGTNSPELGVAQGMGLFALEGLDVKWISMQPATNLLIAALLSDQVQILSSGISPFFIAAQKDISITYFFSTARFGSAAALYARNELKATVKTPNDLSGRTGLRCGSGSPGTTTYAALEWYMKFYGFKCDAIVTMTSPAVAVGSLQSGSIDVIGQNYINAVSAIKEGAAYMLVDPTDPATYMQLFGTQQLPNSGYLASAKYVQANPVVIQKYVDALLLADMFMRSHTTDQIATVILRAPGVTETREQVISSVDAILAFRTATPGYVSKEDWNGNLTFNAKFLGMDTSGPAFAYGTFWDGHFVENSPFFTP